MLVGNKADKEDRVVSTEEGAELAATFGVPFMETSAKDNLNVEECYTALAGSTLKRWMADNASTPAAVSLSGRQESKGGCC
mmetsp:Transcript_37834/g.118559  ORF Transcript_37834/g.118559 Transcript_37834/m.118559 type:complete len:81 (-) Transcript_37834:118-360(-)